MAGSNRFTVMTNFFTARKRSLQRLCFYTCLSVILFTRGGLPQCMLGYHPQGAGTPRKQIPPWTRHPPGAAPPPGADPPDQAPPGTRPPSRAVHAERYGQRAGGTHPTGMQYFVTEIAETFRENSIVSTARRPM